VKVLRQLGKVQYIEGSRDEDEDGDMERCGDVELLCGSGEMVLDLVEEASLLFLSMSDFLSRSDVLSRSDSLLSRLSRRLVSR
jgi:hypothetical protein